MEEEVEPEMEYDGLEREVEVVGRKRGRRWKMGILRGERG